MERTLTPSLTEKSSSLEKREKIRVTRRGEEESLSSHWGVKWEETRPGLNLILAGENFFKWVKRNREQSSPSILVMSGYDFTLSYLHTMRHRETHVHVVNVDREDNKITDRTKRLWGAKCYYPRPPTLLLYVFLPKINGKHSSNILQSLIECM